jgi:hypothetical protein
VRWAYVGAPYGGVVFLLDGLACRTPAEVFDQIEAGTLTPLPATAFTVAEWSRAKVAPDVHVKCGKALYSVPWKLIGQHVDIRATATMVQIFHHGELMKSNYSVVPWKGMAEARPIAAVG